MWLPLGFGPIRWSLYPEGLRSKSGDFLRLGYKP